MMPEFAYFWILVLIPVFLAGMWWIFRRGMSGGIRFSSIMIAQKLPVTWRIRLSWIPLALRVMAVILFLIALSRPRFLLQDSRIRAEGIDIVLAVDISGSMAAEDFMKAGKRVNRLEIVKDVVEEFIAKRKYDRIALVAFGGRAYTVAPLTTDYEWLRANLGRVEIGLVEDGTAIGSAIATSTLRLKDTPAKSKVIILLTDGINNAGELAPDEAAHIAKSFNIKTYTIGAGSRGMVPFPAEDRLGRKFYQNVQIDIDDALLNQVAELTGGRYFRATDTESLKSVYAEIDSLEKVEFEQKGFFQYNELFAGFVFGALVLIMAELILRNTIFLRIP